MTMTTFTIAAGLSGEAAVQARLDLEALGLVFSQRLEPRGPIQPLLIHLTEKGRRVGRLLLEIDALLRPPDSPGEPHGP